MKKKKSTVFSRKREAQLEAGLYDGRFSTKIVKDKKKEMSKKACKMISKHTILKVNL
jgi:hypothetical protein